MYSKSKAFKSLSNRIRLGVLCILLLYLMGCTNKEIIDPERDDSLSSQMLQSAIEGTIDQSEAHLAFGIRKDGYEVYKKNNKDYPLGTEEIVVDLENFDSHGDGFYWDPAFLNTGRGTLITPEEGSVSWTVEVPEDALYQIYIEYFPIDGKGDSIERQVEINGEVPFYGARHFIMSRVWKDFGKPSQDNRGNEIRPSQVESPHILSSFFTDYLGYSEIPYQFYLKKGTNEIAFRSVKEPLGICRILLTQQKEIPSYEEVSRGYSNIKSTGLEPIKIQGETIFEKSDPMLYAGNDRSTPATEPSHIYQLKLNTIGGINWKLTGQWVSWEVDVPEEGLYRLGIRARQNLVHGLNVNRKLFIDGEIPFQEAQALKVDYSTSWQMVEFGDGDKPYLLHLTKGRHVLTMETSLGALGSLLKEVENSVFALNYAYRKILMLTGPSPDAYRDYNIEKELPEIMEILAEQSVKIADLSRRIEEYGSSRSQTAILNRMSQLLGKMYTNPFTIPKSIMELNTNIGAMSTWMLTSREQPLEIDYFMLLPEDEETPSGKANFISALWYRVASFVTSFFQDYDSVGDAYGEDDDVLTVWILSGRDQAQVLKRMIDDTFTPNTGIPVNLKLVLPDVLLPATVAGMAPDVAMQVYNNMPMDYALRNAVVDLTQFPDFEEVAERFHESATVPYKYNNGVFALPDAQNFLMMFYRKDIFEELNLEVPKTWEDLIYIMPELQKNHMEFGVPVRLQVLNTTDYGSVKTYEMLLFQNQGKLYKEDGIAVNIDNEVGIKTFEQWTNLFVNYKLPEQYDFRNRFRSGQMPIGIVSYMEYNTLVVFAPEIRGLWEFVPVPGTRLADGSIDNSAPADGQATVMMEDSEHKEEAWEFMKWWTSADIQVRYGKEMESIMGPAARHPTANLEAVSRLAWPLEDYRHLQAQWDWVKGVPEIPGSYYLPRHVDNAFRTVVNGGDNPREALLEYSKKINTEISSKRREFGLTTLEDLKNE